VAIAQACIETSYDEELIPRFLQAGRITLDLLYRDGRIADKWLSLHPREFELFWRLAREPGVAISKAQLLSDVWRISFDPQSNSVAVHVARIRQKLRPFGLEHILATDRELGYLLNT